MEWPPLAEYRITPTRVALPPFKYHVSRLVRGEWVVQDTFEYYEQAVACVVRLAATEEAAVYFDERGNKL